MFAAIVFQSHRQNVSEQLNSSGVSQAVPGKRWTWMISSRFRQRRWKGNHKYVGDRVGIV